MSTLREHEDPRRDVAKHGSRFWLVQPDAQILGDCLAFGEGTVGIVDELAGGVVAYAHADNAEAIIEALQARLGEI